jgi:asparagine synthase (glutamine-hydrolysing)
MLATLKSTIARSLDIGHLPMRMEHWAMSGARRGIVYSYPLLDRRLVELALAARSSIPQRQIFIRNISDLLPGDIDWVRDDEEPATLEALKKEHLAALIEWASEERQLPDITRRLIDPARIRHAIEAAQQAVSFRYLQGVREAIGCYYLPRSL